MFREIIFPTSALSESGLRVEVLNFLSAGLPAPRYSVVGCFDAEILYPALLFNERSITDLVSRTVDVETRGSEIFQRNRVDVKIKFLRSLVVSGRENSRNLQ